MCISGPRCLLRQCLTALAGHGPCREWRLATHTGTILREGALLLTMLRLQVQPRCPGETSMCGLPPDRPLWVLSAWVQVPGNFPSTIRTAVGREWDVSHLPAAGSTWGALCSLSATGMLHAAQRACFSPYSPACRMVLIQQHPAWCRPPPPETCPVPANSGPSLPPPPLP